MTYDTTGPWTGPWYKKCWFWQPTRSYYGSGPTSRRAELFLRLGPGALYVFGLGAYIIWLPWSAGYAYLYLSVLKNTNSPSCVFNLDCLLLSNYDWWYYIGTSTVTFQRNFNLSVCQYRSRNRDPGKFVVFQLSLASQRDSYFCSFIAIIWLLFYHYLIRGDQRFWQHQYRG